MLVFAVLVLMAVVFHFFTQRQIKSDRLQLQENMERMAVQIATVRLTKTENWSAYQEWIDQIIESDAGKDLIYIAIFDEKRELVAYSLNASALDVKNAQYLTEKEQYDIVQQLSRGQVSEESWNDFDHKTIEIRWGRDSLGKVDVGFSLINFNNKVKRKLLINVYILVGAFFFIVSLSVYVAKRITDPLNTLASAMLEVSQGNFNLQVQNTANDEIGNLSRSFNYMTTRLTEKTAIEDFSRDLVFSFEHTKLIQLVTERIVTYMGAKQGVFFIIEKKGDQLIANSVWGYPIMVEEPVEFVFDEFCQDECLQKKSPFTPEEISDKQHFINLFNSIKSDIHFDQLGLVAPFMSQGEILGFLLLAPETDGTEYDPDEKVFLRTLTHQAAMAIRNAFLLKDVTEQERLKRELEIARSVQKQLLPAKEPEIKGLGIAGLCIPAAEVGGDYFDYFFIDPQRIGIVIADVSGKGTSAAFYMAEIKGMMTAMTNIIDSPKELLRKLNTYLCTNIDKRIFTTMIYGILDVYEKQFKFVRAGHNALVVKHNSGINDLNIHIPQGMGLGLAQDDVFQRFTEEVDIKLNHGDALIFYTDGIAEAMNDKQEEFGEDRLFQIIAENDVTEPQDFERFIIRHINDFVKDAKQHDDITMIIAKIG